MTAERTRFLVLTRFSFEDMRRSRFLTIFFTVSMIVPLIYALLIYFHHNIEAQQLLKIKMSDLLPIDNRFFMTFLGFQSMAAFFMSAFVGPGLVSPDLANNALPLYLARPFSRAEYVMGRMSVLLILLSAMTWVPGLVLFGLQSNLNPGWMGANLHIARGLFAGAWVWIVVLSLLALTLSAWVKWKPIAGGLMFGVFFVAAGFGAAINGILRTKWGSLINVGALVGTVWNGLFDDSSGRGALFFRIPSRLQIPEWSAWTMLTLVCGLCLLLLLKRIRGVEVVR